MRWISIHNFDRSTSSSPLSSLPAVVRGVTVEESASRAPTAPSRFISPPLLWPPARPPSLAECLDRSKWCDCDCSASQQCLLESLTRTGAEKEGKRQSKREGEEVEAGGVGGGWNKAWLPSRDPALASEVSLSLVLHLDLPVLSFFYPTLFFPFYSIPSLQFSLPPHPLLLKRASLATAFTCPP